MYIARVKRKPGRPEYLRRGIGVLLACLLLWQQVAVAAHGCASAASAGPDTVQMGANPHDGGCANELAACAHHCAQAAVRSQEAAIHFQTHFPGALPPYHGFLHLEYRVADAAPSGDGPRAPPGAVPARLLFCSLQI